MSFDGLKKEMKDKNFSHKFHFFGEETYVKNAYFQRLKSLLVEDGLEEFNLLVLEDEAKVQDADEFVNTAFLMGDKKLLVLKNTGLFKSANANKDFWKNIFSDIPDYIYIIAYEDNFDKRNAVYKAFSENCQSVNFEKRTRAEIKSYIFKTVQKNNKTMDNNAAELFLDNVGNDMYTVVAEINKLLSKCSGKEKITYEDVSEIVVKEHFTKEYVLTDALLKNDKRTALQALSELLEMRFDPVMLVYVISSSYISAYKAKLMLDEHLPYANIEKALNLPMAFLAKKYIEAAGRLSMPYIKKSIDILKDADYSIKSGDEDPETCLKKLVCSLLY